MSAAPWLRAIQIALTLVLLAWLGVRLEWAALEATLRAAYWPWLLLAAALVLLSHVANVARWQLLMPQTGVTFRALLSYYGAGIFSNNFLPTGIGGDGVRAALLARHIALHTALWSVALDRLVGLAGLLLLALPGLWLGLPPFAAGILDALMLVGMLPLVGLLLLLVSGIALLCWHVPSVRRRLSALLRPTAPSHDQGRWAKGWPWAQLAALGLAVISALCLFGTHICVLLALGVGDNVGAALWLVVIGSLALLVPVSVNGLGVLESVYVLLLANYGVAAATALGVALCIRCLIVFFSALGGLLALRLGRWSASTAPAREGRAS